MPHISKPGIISTKMVCDERIYMLIHLCWRWAAHISYLLTNVFTVPPTSSHHISHHDIVLHIANDIMCKVLLFVLWYKHLIYHLLACRGDCFTWRGSTRGLGPLLHVWQYNHKKWRSRMHECDEDDNWISSLRQKVRQLDLWLQTFFIVMHLDVTVICTLYIYQI